MRTFFSPLLGKLPRGLVSASHRAARMEAYIFPSACSFLKSLSSILVRMLREPLTAGAVGKGDAMLDKCAAI